METSVTFQLVDPSLFTDSEEEIDEFIQEQVAKNTLSGNKYSINVFNRFCSEINEKRDIENLQKN